MKWAKFQAGVIGIITVSLLTLLPLVRTQDVLAQASDGFIIDQVNVTADQQFVRLNNLGETAATLENYELLYLNADNKPSKVFTFAGSIPPAGFFLLSDTQLTLCYMASVESVSLGLSTTGGALELWHYNETRTAKSLVSSLTWIKTPKSTTPPTTVKLPESAGQFLMWQESDWYYATQNSEDCTVTLTPRQPNQGTEETVVQYEFLPGTMPPVRHVAAASTSTAKVNRNVGKMAPIVNEILPNPASPQTDADDEFIELYNPNDSSFDLSDFKLAFGATSPRKYTFPEGTVLGAKEFKAFTSGDTSISLSNTEAQVWLLDPNEKIISQSEPYSKAKDGQAWALDNGKWVWTSIPTPNEMNALSGASSNAGAAKTAAAVLGISNSGRDTASASGSALDSSKEELDDTTPLHPAVLAGVGLAALAYAVYEYRQDLSNRIFQLRRYLEHRRALRQKMPRR